MRILVVDDYPGTALSMAMLLRREGYEVEVALDGWTALQQARANQPDVVLLDISLPGIDGYEVARCLRAWFQTQVRLIAISALGFDEDRKQGLEAGFDLHLVKPADPKEVLSILREAALA